MMRKIILYWLMWCSSTLLMAQQGTNGGKDSIPTRKLPSILLFDFMYGVQVPAGTMAEDFMFNFNLGGRINVYMPSNWWVALTGDFQFFDNLKTDVVAPLRNNNGYIVTQNGNLADVHLGQRGFIVGAMVGKLIPIKPKKHPRMGIDIGGGGGYMQHWIRIRLLDGNIVQLQGDYKKGYDRMTSGFALQEYVGFRYLSKNKLLNVTAGFDLFQGFTQNRRPINFDTGQADKRLHIDLLFGVRVGLSLPLYIHSEESLAGEKVEYY